MPPTSHCVEWCAAASAVFSRRCTGSCAMNSSVANRIRKGTSLSKKRGRRIAQQPGAGEPAHQAGTDHGQEARLDRPQFAPVAPGASHRARPDGYRAGGVGGHRIETQPDEGGKRNQGAAACHRIDGAGQKSRAEGYRRDA